MSEASISMQAGMQIRRTFTIKMMMMMMMKALWVRAPFGAPRAYLVTACFSQLGLLRQQFKRASKASHTHRSRDIWDSWGKVDLQACENEAGNAANVPLLHELQHGAPRRKQVRILGTNTGDKKDT